MVCSVDTIPCNNVATELKSGRRREELKIIYVQPRLVAIVIDWISLMVCYKCLTTSVKFF